MPRLFNFAKRPNPPTAQLDVSELEGAQLAISFCTHSPGEFCFCRRVSPMKLLFTLLEVGGRGDERRKIIEVAEAVLHESAPSLLGEAHINEADAMVEVCSRLNRAILQAGKRICSCTAFAGCYNEHLGTVCYFSAGHVPALLLHDLQTTELQATGLPLGLFSHSTPDAPTVALPPGAALVVVSRRMVEASRKGKQFGYRGIRECLEQEASRHANDICTSLTTHMHGFLRTHHLQPISMLALTRQPRAVAAAG